MFLYAIHDMMIWISLCYLLHFTMEVVNELITAISAQIPRPPPGKPNEVSQHKYTKKIEKKHLYSTHSIHFNTHKFDNLEELPNHNEFDTEIWHLNSCVLGSTHVTDATSHVVDQLAILQLVDPSGSCSRPQAKLLGILASMGQGLRWMSIVERRITIQYSHHFLDSFSFSSPSLQKHTNWLSTQINLTLRYCDSRLGTGSLISLKEVFFGLSYLYVLRHGISCQESFHLQMALVGSSLQCLPHIRRCFGQSQSGQSCKTCQRISKVPCILRHAIC